MPWFWMLELIFPWFGMGGSLERTEDVKLWGRVWKLPLGGFVRIFLVVMDDLSSDFHEVMDGSCET